MRVPATSFSIVTNQQLKLKNNQSKNRQVSDGVTFCSNELNLNYLTPNLHIYEINKLKSETQMFPEDIKYREKLMINAGLNPRNQHHLRSIIGPQEIRSVLNEFDAKPDVFSVGDKWENVTNYSMRANMHMHTLASDGSLTVTELLDKASEYADKVKSENPKLKDPFVVAITDHDTTDSAKEAIKIISDRPLKYKNLRVILGVEMTTFNNIEPEMTGTPVNTHVLIYGIDPNEPRFKNFIDVTKLCKNKIQESMVDDANKVAQKHLNRTDFYSTVEAKQQYNPLNKNIIGIYNGMEKYFETKFTVEHILLNDKKIKKGFIKHNIAPNTEMIMERFSEYNASLNGNNKVLSPKDALPEFVEAVTTIRKDYVSDLIDKSASDPLTKSFIGEMRSTISKYKVGFKPKYHYMPTFKTLDYNLTEQKDVIMGIAHPVDTLKNVKNEKDKYLFLDSLHNKFREECGDKAIFTEAYYQSYKPERKVFNSLESTKTFFEYLSKCKKFLRSGSADTHGLNIFIR